MRSVNRSVNSVIHLSWFPNGIIIHGVSGEMYLFYFDITFFWKMILNFRLLENNELICPFYACFFVFENLDFGQKVFARAGIRTRAEPDEKNYRIPLPKT